MSEWRLLLDEDSVDAAAPLGNRGFDVLTVPQADRKGLPDGDVIELAHGTDRLLVTADRDFLDAKLASEVTILMVPTGRVSGEEIGRRVQRLADHADPDQLGHVTWLTG